VSELGFTKYFFSAGFSDTITGSFFKSFPLQWGGFISIFTLQLQIFNSSTSDVGGCLLSCLSE
jgi:hypothetical protein